MGQHDTQSETREKGPSGPQERRTQGGPTPYPAASHKCACGCGRALTHGRLYASFGCIATHRAEMRQAGGADTVALSSYRREQDARLPQRSWWLDVPRDSWAAAVEAERVRISLTKLGGQIGWTVTAEDVAVDRRVLAEGRP